MAILFKTGLARNDDCSMMIGFGGFSPGCRGQDRFCAGSVSVLCRVCLAANVEGRGMQAW